MIQFEIRRRATLAKDRTFQSNPVPPQAILEPGRKLTKTDRKRLAFDNALLYNEFKEGDEVSFKQASRGSEKWKVIEIETEFSDQLRWTRKKTHPCILLIERSVVKPGGRVQIESMWTYPEALKKGK